MRRTLPVLAILLLSTSTVGAQQGPGIRPLGPVNATSSERFVNIQGVRALPDGGVLVNDVGARRVARLDESLAVRSIVADSTSATATAYSGRVGGLIPYRGDSTLFVDPTSLSMLVIDPAGKVARVMSVPRSEDAAALGTTALGAPGFDAKGRLVYRQPPRIQFRMPAGGPPSGRGSGDVPLPEMPDSLPIVRVDLGTRVVDTVAFVRIPRPSISAVREESGRISITAEVNPLPTVDEWAVMADGSLALVRGRDYRVEFIDVDGNREAPVKIPFEWQRLTDEDKVAFIDSVRVARERIQADAGAIGGGGGAQRVEIGAMTIVTRQGGAGAGAQGAAGAAAGTGGPMMAGGSGPQVNFVSPDQLPDYKPAFFAGAVRADAEGHLWVRTIPTRTIPGGPVFDVINRKGELVERVQIPEGRTIVGFAPGGAVFMTSQSDGGTVLERASAR